MVTEKRLAELRALAAKATPGPWQPGTYRTCTLDAEGNPVANDTRPADTAFIAAAREAVPELLAEVARLRGIVGRLVGDDEGTW